MDDPLSNAFFLLYRTLFDHLSHFDSIFDYGMFEKNL